MVRRILLIVSLVSTSLLILAGLVYAQDSGPQSIDAPQAVLGTAFTYQGQLKSGGAGVTGSCEMAFRLYDAVTVGNLVGVPLTQTVTVNAGLFTAQLDFGASAFDGQARWLETAVKCPGDAAFTTLSRQALTAAPYALYAPTAGTAANVTNGVYTTGAYANPAWLTSLAGSKISGAVATATTAGSAPWSGLTGVPAEFADGIDNTANYQNVVIVAKSGGDYATMQAAIDSITTASASNPYLVWVAPGIYTEQVTLKPYVHVQGAGQEATVIGSMANNAAWPPVQATLVLTHHTSLRDLSIRNNSNASNTYRVGLLARTGVTQTVVADVTVRVYGSALGVSYNRAIALVGPDAGFTLQAVTALADSGGNHTALYNDGGTATLLGGTYTARGGTSAYALYNFDTTATLLAENVTALAENGPSNYGLYNDNGTATLRGGSFTGRGGTSVSYGLYNGGTSSVLNASGVTALGDNASNTNIGLGNVGTATLDDCTVTGRAGTSAYGIRQFTAGSLSTTVTRSSVEGATNAILRSVGVVDVSNSRLIGGAVSGTVSCTLVSRGTAVNTGTTCP